MSSQSIKFLNLKFDIKSRKCRRLKILFKKRSHDLNFEFEFRKYRLKILFEKKNYN